MPHIPNAEKAIVDRRKLVDYVLNPTHPRGKHKARLFRSALGLTADNADELERRLLDAVQSHEATQGTQDVYGQRYVVEFTMKRGGRQASIRSAWIIRHDEEVPRLLTCYVL